MNIFIVIEPNWIVIEKIQVPIKKLSPNLQGMKIGVLADFI